MVNTKGEGYEVGWVTLMWACCEKLMITQPTIPFQYPTAQREAEELNPTIWIKRLSQVQQAIEMFGYFFGGPPTEEVLAQAFGASS
jgi:hypothetical protein